MRIDDYSTSTWMKNTLATNRASVLDIQQQAASGKRYAVRSAAPVEMSKLADLRQTITETDRWKVNVGTGLLGSQNTEPLLTSLSENIQRAQELAVQGGDASLTTSDRQILGAEANALLEAVVGIANTKHGDIYVFSGTDSSNPAAAVVRDANGQITSVTAAIGELRSVQTAPTETISYGARASGVTDGLFVQPDPLGGPDKMNIFTSLITLRDSLLAGGPPNNTALSTLDDGLKSVGCRLMESGVQQSRFAALDQHLLRIQDAQTSERVNLEEPDMAEVLTDLSRLEATLTATMQIAGRMNKMNILDYLP